MKKLMVFLKSPHKKHNAFSFSGMWTCMHVVLFLIAFQQVGFAVEKKDIHLNNSAQTDQVKATLVASVEAVSPGAELYLGVNQAIIPHWHTYWLNPGDSGNATTIEWTLPEGTIAGDILWPAPSRFSMGPITNYGYENDVTLLTLIKLPEHLQAGSSFTARAVVDWLVCEEECIPQQVDLSLTLPVVAASQTPLPKSAIGAAYIETALSQLPVTSPWPISFHAKEALTALNPSNPQKAMLQIFLDLPNVDSSRIQDVWFYPNEWGWIRQSEPQSREISAQGILLSIPVGETPAKVGEELKGVLVLTERDDDGNTLVNRFAVEQVVQPAFSAQNTPSLGLVFALLLAFAGGIILNLMPCVFPVLSLKALSLIQHAQQSLAHIRLHGLAYTLGILVSFTLLAVVLIALKAGGAQIGWGFQFQSPVFVLLVAYLMFAVGLSLSGVYYIGGSIAGAGSSLAEKQGYSGSFFTGVLATIVATPCTAPFMAAAVGYALVQPALQLLAIFLALGLGLAAPYLLISFWPRLQKWLPRPGVWMDRLKQVLAFPMYLAAVWLVWVLAQQAGPNAVAAALFGIVLIALAAWIYQTTRTGSDRARHIGTVAACVVLVLAIGAGYYGVKVGGTPSSEQPQHAQNWEPFSEERLQALLDNDQPVFLNFTAAWCISCLVNERVALSDERVKRGFADAGITYLKGDWTNRDEAISQFLAKFGRSGVPLYVFYAGKEATPVQLPQILTADIVLAAVNSSSSSVASSLSPAGEKSSLK